jgi:Tol biopolymer transport system component/DNA-binding winged helix-turn-helix (wHTH) protein
VSGAEKTRVVRFGAFEADLRSGELRRNGFAVKLQGQPFQILAMLLERPGELVTRDEIRQQLWPADTFVDFEHSLNAAIKRLRDALGESAETPVFIETLPRRGYRFLSPLRNGSATVAQVPVLAVLQIKRWRNFAAALAGALFLAAALSIAVQRWGFFSFHSSQASAPPLRVVPFTTSPGAEFAPSFSPDGKQIAFVWDRLDGKPADLYVKFIGAEEPLRLSHSTGSVCVAAWSPDGQYVAFSRSSGVQGIFIVPALTGPERKLSDESACIGLAWSRDGKFLVFPSKDSAAVPWHIAALSLETMQEHRITSPPSNAIGDHRLCVSPDSKTVAYTRVTSPAVTDLYLSPIEGGGEARRITFDKTAILGCAWSEDGQSVVIASTRGGASSLWRVPISGDAPERVSGAGPLAFDPAISPQGNKLAYRAGAMHTNIWRVDLDARRQASAPTRPLMKSSLSDDGPQFSPDGSRIVLSSQRSGSPEVWIANADGSEPIQLTSRNVLSGSPRWSPDGRLIAFDSRTGEHSQVFVIPSAGGTPRQLTHGDFDASVPTWSRDGQWIYFTTNRLGIWQLFKLPTQGGEPIQVTADGGFIGLESSDGTELYYWKDNDYGIWKMPLPNGEETRILPIGLDWGRWALTQNGIYFIDTNLTKPTISFFNFADKHISRIATVGKDLFFEVPGFDVSPDERTILFLQVEKETDIMLVENFH